MPTIASTSCATRRRSTPGPIRNTATGARCGRAISLQATNADQAADDALPAGWFIALGSGDVLTAALTVAGRTTFAIADSTGRLPLRLQHRDAGSHTAPIVTKRKMAHWRTTLAGELTIGTAFVLAMDSADTQTTTARCLFGDAHVAACDVDMRPQRTWWRREDAE